MDKNEAGKQHESKRDGHHLSPQTDVLLPPLSLGPSEISISLSTEQESDIKRKTERHNMSDKRFTDTQRERHKTAVKGSLRERHNLCLVDATHRAVDFRKKFNTECSLVFEHV
jgi:hypothetical protein